MIQVSSPSSVSLHQPLNTSNLIERCYLVHRLAMMTKLTILYLRKSKSFSAWRVESNNFVRMMLFSFEKLFQSAWVTVYSALCTMLQKPSFTKIQLNPRNATAHFKHWIVWQCMESGDFACEEWRNRHPFGNPGCSTSLPLFHCQFWSSNFAIVATSFA